MLIPGAYVHLRKPHGSGDGVRTSVQAHVSSKPNDGCVDLMCTACSPGGYNKAVETIGADDVMLSLPVQIPESDTEYETFAAGKPESAMRLFLQMIISAPLAAYPDLTLNPQDA